MDHQKKMIEVWNRLQVAKLLGDKEAVLRLTIDLVFMQSRRQNLHMMGSGAIGTTPFFHVSP